MNSLYEYVRLLLIVILLTMAGSSFALNTHFSGFGTASLSCFSNDSADYVINDQPEGPGRTRNCDAGIDSLLGVQLDLGFSESVEFGLQIIADRNQNASFTPEVTVAQLRWQFTDAWILRIGRMPTSAFLHTENRQVRFTMPWVRPPLEIYGLLPIFSNDGAEIIHEGSFGSWHTEWHGGLTHIEFDSAVSNSNETLPVDSSAAFLNLTMADRNTLVKFGYSYGKTTFTSPGIETLFTVLGSLGTSGSALADDLALDDSAFHLFSIGLRHEHEDWLALSEIAYRSIDSFFRDQYGAYATLGRRFGSWMPYATLAKRWSSGPDSDSRVAGSPVELQQGVEELLAGTRFDTSSVSLGLSREITEQAILKFQADWIKPDSDSWGLYTNHSADYNFANPDSDWLFTLSLDFVF